jgi:hypothetical protein
MGFEPQETLYKLTWEDPAMAGLEVTVREPSIDQLLSMDAIGAADGKGMDTDKVRGAFRIFADLLDSWNVERKGEPVPATYEGVVSQSPGFVMKIISAMGREFAKPDPTLQPGSGGGGTSAPLIPMLPASPGS